MATLTCVTTGNRFSWMSSGYSQTEMDPSADWACYISNTDHSPFSTKFKRREILTGAQSSGCIPLSQSSEEALPEEKRPLIQVVEIQPNGLAI